MNRISALHVCCLSLTLLAACASGASDAGDAPATAGALMLEEVSPRPLPDGRCSLILYSREPAARRILVAFDDPAEAVIRTGGREYTLRRQAMTGDVLHGHASQAVYGGSAGLSLAVALTFEPSPATDGAPIRDASVTVSRLSGESIIIPAVGIAACTPPAGRASRQ